MEERGRVLIIDDDVAVSQATQRVLERAGFAVSMLDSGFGAVVAVRNWRPDVVLLDVSMPGLNGTSVQKVLASFFEDRGIPAVPVVFWSGLPDSELNALAQGVSAWAISKKTRPDQLVARLDAILENIRTLRRAGGDG